MNGFSKATDTDLKNKCIAACAANRNQPFFDADLTCSSLRTLYRTNVRSILSYGIMLTDELEEMEKLDKNMLNNYFKPIIQHKRALSDKLIDRFCLRIRLPSLAIELEASVKGWLTRLRNNINLGANKKSRQHARDTIEAEAKMKPSTVLRKHYSERGGSKTKILLTRFQR